MEDYHFNILEDRKSSKLPIRHSGNLVDYCIDYIHSSIILYFPETVIVIYWFGYNKATQNNIISDDILFNFLGQEFKGINLELQESKEGEVICDKWYHLNIKFSEDTATFEIHHRCFYIDRTWKHCDYIDEEYQVFSRKDFEKRYSELYS